MLRKTLSTPLIDYIIEKYNYCNPVPIDELEIKFYREATETSVKDGTAWSFKEATIHIIERPYYHEIVYFELSNNPADNIKLISYMVAKYDTLRLRPLGTYFYGLMYLLTENSVKKYIRGKDFLTNIYYPQELANKCVSYLYGL